MEWLPTEGEKCLQGAYYLKLIEMSKNRFTKFVKK